VWELITTNKEITIVKWPVELYRVDNLVEPRRLGVYGVHEVVGVYGVVGAMESLELISIQR